MALLSNILTEILVSKCAIEGFHCKFNFFIKICSWHDISKIFRFHLLFFKYDSLKTVKGNSAPLCILYRVDCTSYLTLVETHFDGCQVFNTNFAVKCFSAKKGNIIIFAAS